MPRKIDVFLVPSKNRPFFDFWDHHYADLMSNGRKRGSQIRSKIHKKIMFYAWDPFLDHLRRFGVIFVRPWLIWASFWKLFGMLYVRFWHFVTCFWINSRASCNLQESIFASLITDSFLNHFLGMLLYRCHFGIVFHWFCAQIKTLFQHEFQACFFNAFSWI